MKNKVSRIEWSVHTPNLLREIGDNNEMFVLSSPLMILASLLAEVATRASQLNDDKLNSLMCRLTLYEISDPYSKEYDEELSNKIKNMAKE